MNLEKEKIDLSILRHKINDNKAKFEKENIKKREKSRSIPVIQK